MMILNRHNAGSTEGKGSRNNKTGISILSVEPAVQPAARACESAVESGQIAGVFYLFTLAFSFGLASSGWLIKEVK